MLINHWIILCGLLVTCFLFCRLHFVLFVSFGQPVFDVRLSSAVLLIFIVTLHGIQMRM